MLYGTTPGWLLRRDNKLRLASQHYVVPQRSLTTALTAPSNSGSVQIKAVAIRRSDTTSQTARSPEWLTGLGRADNELSPIAFTAGYAAGAATPGLTDDPRSRRMSRRFDGGCPDGQERQESC